MNREFEEFSRAALHLNTDIIARGSAGPRHSRHSEFQNNMTQTVEAALSRLLERLKTAQRDLLLTAAKSNTLPSDGMLRKISELEGAIAAAEALMQEERERQ